jgi:hypothetical protein
MDEMNVRSVYPQNMKYYLEKLNNYQKNRVRLVNSNPNAQGGDILRIPLPNNSIIDTHSFLMIGKMYQTKKGSITAGTNDVSYRLPNLNQDVISRVSCLVNGKTISNINNYNILYRIHKANDNYDGVRRGVLLGDYETGETKSVGSGSVVAINTPRRSFACDSWLGGFFGMEPRYIDTSYLGNCEVEITIESGNICGCNNFANIGDGNLKVVLEELEFSIEVVSVNDGVYYNVLDSAISERENGLEISYKNYINYNNTGASSNSLNFNVSTNCLDRLVATRRLSTFNAEASNIINITGGGKGLGGSFANKQSAYISLGTLGAVDASTDSSEEVAFFVMGQDTSASVDNQLTTYQYQVNNTFIPSNLVKVNESKEAQAIVLSAFNHFGDSLSGCGAQSFDRGFKEGAFSMCVSTSHNGSGERLMSGLDSQGGTFNCSLNTTSGSSNSVRTDAFACMTSILNVLPNKVVLITQ